MLCTRAVTHRAPASPPAPAGATPPDQGQPVVVASLAQGALFAEGTHLWHSHQELATNGSQTQPAAFCCVLAASPLHGKQGWGSPH